MNTFVRPAPARAAVRPSVIIYTVAPVDLWHGWLTEEQYLESLGRELGDLHAKRAWALNYLPFRERAFAAGRRAGWDGDIRRGEGGPFVSALPMLDGESKVMLAWKQDRNGTTFVASPIALPWLASATAV
ncbi:MAG: hypothetical protein AB7O56_06885 [Bauldia sp.]